MGVHRGQHTVECQHERLIFGLLKLRLATYGKPEFTTDAAHYTPVPH
ncbi:hypothetical protein [Mycobacterium sherrisii]|nr:hypothetical protein [Mycobacterium sherrisii]MCV7031608.1 hypothetical protein [Mycobacterium sherrisii]MEC4765007.1 hypothetical protein [Mycobacterium sherrisii]